MAIERKIIESMHRAIEDGDFQQLHRAEEFYHDYKRAVDRGFIDKPLGPVEPEKPARLDPESFSESLRVSELGSGIGNFVIRRMYGSGSIGRLEDLAHLSDESLLLVQGLGKATLKKIRKIYPFVPQS